MDKRKQLLDWYEAAFDRYGEALQETAADYWQEKHGNSLWEEFHELDKKLKVKFYYEDEQE